MTCAPGEGLCPPNIDCAGTWSSCSRACTKEFSVTRPASGQGAPCEATDGSLSGCPGGMGDCPADIDCLGVWSACASDCSDKMFTITREVSGNGIPCHLPDGTMERCEPGEGTCPPNVDCIGEWLECDAACTRLFVVHTAASGQGNGCQASAGTRTSCTSGASCNDGDDSTSNDICTEALECSGQVVLAAQITYDITVDNLPVPESPERMEIELSVSSSLARSPRRFVSFFGLPTVCPLAFGLISKNAKKS